MQNLAHVFAKAREVGIFRPARIPICKHQRVILIERQQAFAAPRRA